MYVVAPLYSTIFYLSVYYGVINITSIKYRSQKNTVTVEVL